MNKRLKAQIILRFGSQADFAQVVGDSQTIISEVIRNRRRLSDTKAVEWALALGCHPDEIFPDWRDGVEVL
jgi:hypothetical protein